MKISRKVFVSAARILIPLLTGMGILGVLTSVVYSGSKRENLAAIAEGFLIEQAIRFSERPAENPGRVVTVTLQEAEFANFPRAPRTILRDASIEVYANILEKALAADPKLVILNWINGAHYDNLEYLKPVLEVIERFKARDRVFLTFPATYYGIAPSELLSNYPIMEGEDCVYRINRYCSIPDWNTWTVSQLAERLWTSRKPYAVSYNLPHVLPNIIANLPSEDSIPDLSFSAVLRGNGAAVLANAEVITIGNDVLQDGLFSDNKDEIQKTYTALSEPRNNLMRDGIPYHKFWAGLAQMFLDNTTVSVTPMIITRFLTAVVVMIIIIILIKAGSAYALGIYVSTCLAYFFFNNFSMRYFGFYLPIFDVLYTSLLATLLSAFLGISYNLYRQSALTSEREGMSERLDLKSNFLSLVTHNLNTPIAKLKGLFDVIKMQPFYNPNKDLIDSCRRKTCKMQIAVKSVLLSTALEQNNAFAKTVSLKQLCTEFFDVARPIYEPFGIDIQVNSKDDNAESCHLDPKFLIHTILVLIIINSRRKSSAACQFACLGGHLTGSIRITNPLPAKEQKSFLNEMVKKYLSDFMENTGSTIATTEFEGQRLISVTLH